MDGKHDVVAALHNAVLPQADLIHVGPAVAKVAGILEEAGVALEALVDGDGADTGMRTEGLDGFLAGDLPAVLGGGQNGDDVAVGHRGVDQNAGGIDVGHDGHQVHGLVAGGLLHLQGVGKSAVIIAGIGHAADDGDGDLLDAELAVQAVNGTDEAGGVAAGELQELLAQAQLVVGVAMEEHVCHAVLLAALEDGLHAHLFIDGLVGSAGAAGRGVQHHIHLGAKLLKAALHRNAEGIELGLQLHIHQIELVLHAVYADHVVFRQSPDGQRRRMPHDTNQLHVLLQCHAVSQSCADGAVARYADFYFCHDHFLAFFVFSGDAKITSRLFSRRF